MRDDDGADPVEPTRVGWERVDWRLGATTTVELVLRWIFLGAMALLALALVGSTVAMMAKTIAAGRAPTAGSLFLGSTALGATAVVYSIFADYACGDAGWWGHAVTRLAEELPSASGQLSGRLPLVSGLRVPHSRACLVLAAPYRLVVVSRGWNPWVLSGLLVWVGLAAARSAVAPSWVFSFGGSVVAALFCAVVAGHRAEAHEIPWDDLEALTPRGPRRFEFRVGGGPLAPRFTFRPFVQERRRFMSAILQYRPDLVPARELESQVDPSEPPPPLPVPPEQHVEARLSRVQRRLQDED